MSQVSTATTYVVHKGDTLSAIAKRFEISLSDLETANPAKSRILTLFSPSKSSISLDRSQGTTEARVPQERERNKEPYPHTLIQTTVGPGIPTK
jgi:LysM repeat protein